MSQWHPPIDTDATAAYWRAHVERWGAIHAPSCVAADRLRRLILAAGQNNRLSIERDELLGAAPHIDDKERG